MRPIGSKEASSERRTSLKSAVSWLSLVAATTAGLGPSAMVRARVRADVLDDTDGLRLVVQSYLPDQLGSGVLPGALEKPVASTQRAVTAEELRRGVVVDMVQPSIDGSEKRPVLLAWLERGRPDLEFDARLARPRPGMLRGHARARGTASDLSANVRLDAS
ncbi:MAG: hypothetical protein QM784_34345 [Polyangiaceae bacterium]